MSAAQDSAGAPFFEVWQNREAFIERFEAAWLSGQRPAIDDYLPEAAEDRQAVLLELIHTELECRLNSGEAARVEDYLQRYPEIRDDAGVVLDLIVAEYARRRGSEPGLDVAEYLERFPDCKHDVQRRLLQVPPTTPDDSSASPATVTPRAGEEASLFAAMRTYVAPLACKAPASPNPL
jgi:hypothetical protein